MVVAASSVASLVLFLIGGTPWPRRDCPVAPAPAHELESLERWGAEPATPAEIDPAKFRDALAYFCALPAEKVQTLPLSTVIVAVVLALVVAVGVKLDWYAAVGGAVRLTVGSIFVAVVDWLLVSAR